MSASFLPSDSSSERVAMDRRSFLKTLTAAGLSAAALGGTQSVLAAEPSVPASRIRYAIVGVGSRHEMYQDAIEKDYPKWAHLVAVCDLNIGRVELARERSKTNAAVSPRGYHANQFEQMIAETKPDHVIITTVDGFHHDYITRAMAAGCDVITEK